MKTDEQNKWKMQGKERDIETSYDYFEARFYDSAIARFQQVDPLVETFNHQNGYTSMGNRPLNMIDPDGMEQREIGDLGGSSNRTVSYDPSSGIEEHGFGNYTMWMNGSAPEQITGTKNDLTELANNINTGISQVGIKNALVEVITDSKGNSTLKLVGDDWKKLSDGSLSIAHFKGSFTNELATKALIGLGDIIKSESVMNFEIVKTGEVISKHQTHYYDKNGKKLQGGGSNHGGRNAAVVIKSKFGKMIHEILHGHPYFTGREIIQIGGIWGNLDRNRHHDFTEPGSGYTGGYEPLK